MADDSTPDLTNIETALKLANQNMSQLIQNISARFPAESATLSSLTITNSTAGGTTVKSGAGYLMAISANVASTAGSSQAGRIYDANSPANVGSSNVMSLVPLSGITNYVFPFVNGLTIQPSSLSSQAVSVYFL